MPTYTMYAVVELWAETSNEAHTVLRAALDHSRLAEILFIDSTITDTVHDDEPVNIEVQP